MHGKNSGEVGDVGEHGDLGSNAVGWAPPAPSAADLDADAAEKAAAAATLTAPVVQVPSGHGREARSESRGNQGADCRQPCAGRLLRGKSDGNGGKAPWPARRRPKRKIMASRSHYRIQHVATTPRGWKVRSIEQGGHVIRIAFPPGRREQGSGHVVEILHPKHENPGVCSSATRAMNPAELVLMGANPHRGKETQRKAEEIN